MRKLGLFIILASALAGGGLAQESEPQSANRLLTGKLMYVGPMPENVDAWIVEDLRQWGRYKPTREAEGADLAMKAGSTETRLEYKLKRGVPTPKKVENKKGGKPLLFTVSVEDWVTGKTLWSADIINRKPKNGGSKPAHGPEIEINAKGLTGEQIATAIVRELRAYRSQLAAPPPQPHP